MSIRYLATGSDSPVGTRAATETERRSQARAKNGQRIFVRPLTNSVSEVQPLVVPREQLRLHCLDDEQEVAVDLETRRVGGA